MHKNVDFSKIAEGHTKEALDEQFYLTPGYTVKKMDIESLNEQVRSNPEPKTPYPSRSMHPTATPVDHSTHPDGSSSIERQQQTQMSGLPNKVMNIADPAFSERGGEMISNTRRITIRNDKWSPDQKVAEGEKGYEPKFTFMDVPDIGVGSKDIQAQANEASADRLLQSLPMKLYPPIHPQACDRYLGVRNYKRLNVENSQYLKEYSEHPFTEKDIPQMYAWNS